MAIPRELREQLIAACTADLLDSLQSSYEFREEVAKHGQPAPRAMADAELTQLFWDSGLENRYPELAAQLEQIAANASDEADPASPRVVVDHARVLDAYLARLPLAQLDRLREAQQDRASAGLHLGGRSQIEAHATAEQVATAAIESMSSHDRELLDKLIPSCITQ